MNLVFYESRLFSRSRQDYLDDDAFVLLQSVLLIDPERGEVIPGTGGFRKMRWPDSRRGKGTRGGLRIVYYYFDSENTIWFVAVYDKNEVGDLTTSEKRALKEAVLAERNARGRS